MAFGRFDPNNPDFGFLLFQISACPHQGSGSSHTSNEDIHVSVCLRKDFWPGRLVVSKYVVLVRELVGHVVMLLLLLKSLQRPSKRTICLFPGRGKHHLSTKCLKDKPSLCADTFRHEQRHPVTLCGSYHRQGNPHIPRRWLKNGLLFGEFPRFLCFFYHVIGRPVFD